MIVLRCACSGPHTLCVLLVSHSAGWVRCDAQWCGYAVMHSHLTADCGVVQACKLFVLRLVLSIVAPFVHHHHHQHDRLRLLLQ